MTRAYYCADCGEEEVSPGGDGRCTGCRARVGHRRKAPTLARGHAKGVALDWPGDHDPHPPDPDTTSRHQ